MKRAFLFLALACLASAPAAAKPDLSRLQAQLAEQKQNEARLQEQVKTAGGEMAKTKKDMIAAAQSVRENEQALQAVEAKIAPLTKEETDVSAKLTGDYGSMGDMILALARMRRVPPELLIVRPGAPLQTAQTATLLGSILPALNQRTALLSDHLKTLNRVHLALDLERKQAETARDTLNKKYAAIAALADTRASLYKKLNTDYEQTAGEVERISKQASDMQDLMNRLDEREAKRQSGNRHGSSSPYAWSAPSPGRPQLPVPGVLLTGYGQRDDIGATSQGLTIKANPGALVVAPMGGIVRFSGPFRNYGKLVLLEHRDGYLSLIAGFETVDASIGQSLDAGEPVGKLPAASSRGDVPTLYYELRYKGRPVNPSDKFPDLKAKS